MKNNYFLFFLKILFYCFIFILVYSYFPEYKNWYIVILIIFFIINSIYYLKIFTKNNFSLFFFLVMVILFDLVGFIFFLIVTCQMAILILGDSEGFFLILTILSAIPAVIFMAIFCFYIFTNKIIINKLFNKIILKKDNDTKS